MNWKYKTIALLSGTALLIAVLAGCKASGGNGSPAQTAIPAETTLETAVKNELHAEVSTEIVTEVPSPVSLPILDEVSETVTVGVAGSSLSAVQAAVKLLDWGLNTGLDAEEIHAATSAWLTETSDTQDERIQKLELADNAYQNLLTDSARDLLDCAGCQDVEITWGSDPVEPIEAIMRAAGLR